MSSLTASNLSNLQSRLKALVPRIRNANNELEVMREEGRLGERDIENIDNEEEGEGKGYIEMNLGLGLLEEKRKEHEEEGSTGSKSEEDQSEDGERDVLGRLMGRQKEKRTDKVDIQELGSG